MLELVLRVNVSIKCSDTSIPCPVAAKEAFEQKVKHMRWSLFTVAALVWMVFAGFQFYLLFEYYALSDGSWQKFRGEGDVSHMYSIYSDVIGCIICAVFVALVGIYAAFRHLISVHMNTDNLSAECMRLKVVFLIFICSFAAMLTYFFAFGHFRQFICQ